MSALAADKTVGICSQCKTAGHRHCIDPECACDTGAHPSRPILPDGFAWEEPPPMARGGRFELDEEVVELLTANPGKWARVKSYKAKSGAATMAKKIKAGQTPLGAGWDAAGRPAVSGSWLYLCRIAAVKGAS